MTDLASLDRAHSRISPSGFARVEACTASLRLSADRPEAAPGPYALVGTAAHAVLERCLKEGLDTFELGDLAEVQVDGAAIPVDGRMLDGVQIALDAVREKAAGRRFEVEQTLRLGFAEMYLGEPIWGHADVLIREAPLLVIDYKDGYRRVEADAAQLGLYLLMLALEADVALEGEGLAGTTMVVQPNADDGEPVRTHDWTWADLRDLRDRVIFTLRRIKRGDWTFQDGEWCRFCPAAGVCPHLAAVARDAALATIMPTPEMVATGEITAATLADWLDVVDRLDTWSKRVQEVALDYVVHGGVLRDRKLVRKRTTRRWVDDGTAERRLEGLGVDPWQRKLVTPAEAERRLPKAKRADIDGLTEKPDGELTLASADDLRAGVDVAASFKAALRASVASGFLTQAKER